MWRIRPKIASKHLKSLRWQKNAYLFVNLPYNAFEKAFVALATAAEKAYRSWIGQMREVIPLLKEKMTVRANEQYRCSLSHPSVTEKVLYDRSPRLGADQHISNSGRGEFIFSLMTFVFVGLEVAVVEISLTRGTAFHSDEVEGARGS